MILADRTIGPNETPFIIAEMSGNHNQSFDRALAIIDAASKAGVDAMKFQTYTADTMTIDHHGGEFFISDEDSLWYGQSMYELYQKAYTPWEWHEPLFAHCRELGIMPFSAAFDATAVDFLETLNVPCHKIASPENIDIPLIYKAASTGKPLFISTGMASQEELEDAVRTAQEAGCRDILLLKCTTEYPAESADINLRTIPDIRERFGVQVGLSDHTHGIGVSVASVAFGAVAIEKHFTLTRADGGVDSAFSIEPQEMKQLVSECRRAHSALGQVHYGPVQGEGQYIKGRRSLYVVKDIEVGESLTQKNIRSIRPGYGLPPKCYWEILKQKANRNLKKGTPLKWEDISPRDS